jgi:peptidoglycan hydrolase-like protein with peptidoglycan-binding domain
VPSRASRTAALLPALGLSRRDALAVAACAGAIVAILVNTLWMQSGPHPAPMFKPKPVAAKPLTAAEAEIAAPPSAVPAPRPRAVEAATLPPVTPAKSTTAPPSAKAVTPAAARLPGEIITDIQRELARRGFFDGPIDGIYGPKTDGAIRDFEHAAGLKASPEPSEALLQTILRAPVKVARATGTAAPRPPALVRNETERPQPSKRVLAVQRVLADYGYGQIKPTGLVDGETQAAIEKFERERKLPVTGQPSDRVARELSAVTGRPLE